VSRLEEKEIGVAGTNYGWTAIIGRIIADLIALGIFDLGLDMFLSVFGLHGLSYAHSFGLLLMVYGVRIIFVRGRTPSH
jgi:hypothetical protein